MNGDCIIGARHDAEIKALQEQSRHIEEENQRQWDAIGDATEKFEQALREVAGRLPVWATAVACVGAAIIGVLTTLAVR